jgi:trans-aconitate methyltransferase
MFSTTAKYHDAYHLSPYYFLWAVIVDRIRRDGLSRILEIGCGPGQLAAFLLDQGVAEYTGLDFSPKAIEFAERSAPLGHFVVGDARESSIYEQAEHDVLICTEVLEHIEEDFMVISRFRPGVRCIFSVPSFDSASHVRYFHDSAEVNARYGSYFSDLQIASFPVGSSGGCIFLADGYRDDLRFG